METGEGGFCTEAKANKNITCTVHKSNRFYLAKMILLNKEYMKAKQVFQNQRESKKPESRN